MKRFPIVLSAVLVTLAAGCGEVPTSPATPSSSPSFDDTATPPPPVDDDGEETLEEGKSGSMAVSGG